MRLFNKKYFLILFLYNLNYAYSFDNNERYWQEIRRHSKVIFSVSNCSFNKIENFSNKFSKYYKVSVSEEPVGYVVISEAKSKHQTFDFYILYSIKGDILKVSVLSYRENYGYEICNKSWLKQFCNINLENKFTYLSKIDGISGSTISVNSISNSVYNLSRVLNSNIIKIY